VGYSLRQQGTLHSFVAGFRPQGENQQQKDSHYRSAEGESRFQTRPRNSYI
jgi:hypothetical protein